MHRDRSFCAKSVRYNIFTNDAPYQFTCSAWRVFRTRLQDFLQHDNNSTRFFYRETGDSEPVCGDTIVERCFICTPRFTINQD